MFLYIAYDPKRSTVSQMTTEFNWFSTFVNKNAITAPLEYMNDKAIVLFMVRHTFSMQNRFRLCRCEHNCVKDEKQHHLEITANWAFFQESFPTDKVI